MESSQHDLTETSVITVCLNKYITSYICIFQSVWPSMMWSKQAKSVNKSKIVSFIGVIADNVSSREVFGDSEATVSLSLLCIVPALKSLEISLTDQSSSSFWNNEGGKKLRYPHKTCQSSTLNVPSATFSLKYYFRRKLYTVWAMC